LLLIGSRAAKIHFPDFKYPRDYDFIASRVEAGDFLSLHKHEILPSHPKKIRARVKLGGHNKQFEIEIAEDIPSSLRLHCKDRDRQHYDSELKCNYFVASPENLFLLKKSHICFNINWRKNITDYLYLKSKIDEKKLDKDWYDIYTLRFDEIKSRLRYKEHNFDVENSEFFNKSEKFVKRYLPHDNIHYATCFFDKPLFESVKNDLSKAAMSEDKVNSLPHNLKIKLIQEEAIALSIERFVLPAIKKNESYDAKSFYIDSAAKMVYNYLPMFMRLFAADNFLEIIDLPIDYVDKFLKNVKGLDLNLLKQGTL